MATDSSMADMIAMAELIYADRSASVASSLPHIVVRATAIAEPSSPKTSDTVVEVGRPSELNMSRRMMLPSIMPRNRVMICSKVNCEG